MSLYRDPYRFPPKKIVEEIKSRGYVMFKTITNSIGKAYNWWSWDNLFFTCLAVVCIMFITYVSYCIYGTTFLPHTVNGCYVKAYRGYTKVMRDVEWVEDYPTAQCSDQACVDKALKSDQCKPTK